MSLISVVIPVYNGERTIRDAVCSVLAQTFGDFELIVINDGSEDATADILAKIHDPRLKIFTFPNAGLSASRNRGIDLARGTYVSFLDADDAWTRDKLEAQLSALQRHPEAAVCYSWTDFIDEKGQSLGYGIQQTRNGYVFPELLTFFFIGSGSNALIVRTAFETAGRFDEALCAAEDWDMFLRLASDFQFVAVPQAHIQYRIGGSSMSGNVLRQEREMLKVVERAYSREPGKSLIHLKKFTLANLYIYLASRVLKGVPTQHDGILAGQFLWRAFRHNPRTLSQVSYVSTLIFKMVSAILLPPKLASTVRVWAKTLLRRISRRVGKG